ncbi:MAG: hypothetical protein LBI27_09430 [Clostridiales bacterium]|jgi:hypothetical protein|nr:hypothetical protein [Clostridiales bacterium]
MKDIAKENAHFTKKAWENRQKKLDEIENEGADKIYQLVIETENHTSARILEIEEHYREKSKTQEKEFYAKRKSLSKKIFHDVLYGEL